MKRFFIISSLFFILFQSCTARIDGSLTADGSSAFTINMSLLPRMAQMIRSISAAGGQTGNELDGSAIARSMSGASGITSVSFTNTTSSAITGQIRISKINDFLSMTKISETTQGQRSGFIVFEQSASSGGTPNEVSRGKCVININRSNGSEILSRLSPQVVDYFNALLAPIATGEELSKDEYLELVSVFYSNAISDEISRSRIQVSIEFPGRIQNVRGGTFSGRRANFDIALLDLLVLESPLSYEVTWN